MLLDAGLARGSVLVNHGDLNTFLLLQLQCAHSIFGDVGYIHSQVGTRPAIFARENPRLPCILIDGPALRSLRKAKQQR